MCFSDDRLCPTCTGLDLSSLFNPARFARLPALHTPESLAIPWTEYIQHVGDWRPLTREERVNFYPPGIIPACPLCELMLGIGETLNRRSPGTRASTRVILAVPANILYDFAAIDGTPSSKDTPTSAFLLVMNPGQYAEMSQQYSNATAGGGFTPWTRFAHRADMGSLVSITSNETLKPPFQDIPMQGRLLRDEKIDYGLLRSWIHLCQSHHDSCRAPKDWQPVPKFKLIDCQTRHIINTDLNKRYPYVALSYIWGTAPPEKCTYPCLPDDLPPVILDTMQVVLKLGFQYVWIDRYCIWQDDKVHKMSQVERMDQIYGEAELAIIAIGARDPSYGLPGLTLSRTQHHQITKRVGQQRLVAKFSHHWQLSQIARSKWATRGWTFQETCLSRRRLYFSSYEASYECHEMMCFEHLKRPLAFGGSLEHHERPEWNHVKAPHGIWAVVNGYCERELSFASDRLAAVSGVLARWARLNPRCDSYWGVPVVAADWARPTGDALRRAFLAGLEWEMTPERSDGARLPGFPSWSWVSQRGRTRTAGYHITPPNLVEVTEHFNAGVWVETDDGKVVEWGDFCEGGGVQKPFSQWTRFLHLECWAFKVGPFHRRQLKNMAGPRGDLIHIPVASRQGRVRTEEVVLKLLPDSGYGDLSGFTERKFTAISFSPVEHCNFALVLDTVSGLTVRVGILVFWTIGDSDSHEWYSFNARGYNLAKAGFSAQKRRVRLG